jgi:hypothetical protein
VVAWCVRQVEASLWPPPPLQQRHTMRGQDRKGKKRWNCRTIFIKGHQKQKLAHKGTQSHRQNTPWGEARFICSTIDVLHSWGHEDTNNNNATAQLLPTHLRCIVCASFRVCVLVQYVFGPQAAAWFGSRAYASDSPILCIWNSKNYSQLYTCSHMYTRYKDIFNLEYWVTWHSPFVSPPLVSAYREYCLSQKVLFAKDVAMFHYVLTHL